MPIGFDVGGDPIASYLYMLKIDGMQMAQFQKVSGLGVEVTVIDHQDNTESGLPRYRKLPGHVKFGDITLARGRVNNNDFWDWIRKVQDGKIDDARKGGSVILLDYTHSPVQTFNFRNGWPSKVELGDQDASSDDVLLETVTIVHEGVELG